MKDYDYVNPQPIIAFPTVRKWWWKKPPKEMYIHLKLGEYYWVERHWNDYPIEKVRFVKITPKGYGFRKMDLHNGA